MSTKKQAQERAKKDGLEFVDNTLNQPKKDNTHYVKNSILLAELIKCKEQDRLTDEAAEMFRQIATKLSSKMKYTNPDDREDCIAYAVWDCCRYWRDFDPNITNNAFSYITSVCRNGFAKGWRALGKMKCPDSKIVSLSNNIHSI